MDPSKLNLNALTLTASVVIILLLVSEHSPVSLAAEQCEKSGGGCQDKAKAMKLKIIAIISILIASMIGVCLPLFSRSVPALRPDRDLFVLVKLFASGVILATGYMHVLPDSFDCLRSPCLPDNPWHKFPFSAFVAMLFAMVTLMMDSFALTYCRKRNNSYSNDQNQEEVVVNHHRAEEHGIAGAELEAAEKSEVEDAGKALLRNQVVAQVLEFGIVVHSVVIGLSMGASDNPCTIRPLIAALCFHQLFEGMGLGGCILQAEYPTKTKAIMVFFFSTTTPFGIVLGILLSNVYSEDSPTALIMVGLLNAASAGLLNYMALVDLLAAEFLGPKLQGSVKLQIWGFSVALVGVGIMSLMAKWA